MKMIRPGMLTTTAAVTVLMTLSPALASAAPPNSEPQTLKQGLVTPLHLAVASKNNIAVSETFSGKISEIGDKGRRYTTQQPGWGVEGVEYQGTKLYFLESVGAGEQPASAQAGNLKVITADGTVRTVTDQLAAYERANNPDQTKHFGLSDADAAAHPDCAAQLEAIHFPTDYNGEMDSHPYALAVKGHTAYIAEAGANAVLSVDLKSGEISTVAVLPPQPTQVTAESATSLGAPACGGLTYAFEPVPTDIEVGPNGALYVSTLPGGPEGPELGARGKVYKINARTGAATTVVENVLSPTGIALDPRGSLYIASMFGGTILKAPAGCGEATPFLTVDSPADVEIHGSTLYATTDVFGKGKVISIQI